MSHEWDEFCKSLAEPIPRRETLRRLGFLFAGAVLTPLGLGTAWAGGGTDGCTAFCNKCPTSQRTSCLTACRACKNGPSHLCGSCANGYACTDFLNDVQNCGACGHNCWVGAGANEDASCINGACAYACVEGAVDCSGTCTFLDSDPDNCGACGHVCDDPGPDAYAVCSAGTCENIFCDGVDYSTDSYNCGRCGNVCTTGTGCSFGQCVPVGGYPIDYYPHWY